ncbi:MAG: hypothetical protein IT201_14395 [Thermoleophilia bacterium]|nr:hypothetical protein [Thermoleophilia bacterium]
MPDGTKVRSAVATAKPVVERLAKDDEFQKHVKAAYESARHMYDELFADERSARALAGRLATDSDLQDELKAVISELRGAGTHVRKAAQPSATRKGRNTLLLAGLVLGILYNPATGPETRRWLKERVFGPEETFEYEP